MFSPEDAALSTGHALASSPSLCVNEKKSPSLDRCSPSDTWLGKEKDFLSNWTTALYAEVLVVFVTRSIATFFGVLFWLSSKTWDLVLI